MTNNHENINNYQLWCEQWREHFLKMDQKDCYLMPARRILYMGKAL